MVGANPVASVAGNAGQLKTSLHGSIFVLPFAPLSGNDIGQRFAAALSEELIVEFGKHCELTVFAVPSVIANAENPTPVAPPAIGARMVLRGSVRIAGAKLRVIAHLIDQADHRHVWSASFDRRLKRPASTDLQRDIGRRICRALTAHLRRTSPLAIVEGEPGNDVLQRLKSARLLSNAGHADWQR